MWIFLCLISPAEFCDLALVDTWYFSKSAWSPIDRKVTWNSRWGFFNLTHNLIKFNGHWCCEKGDAPFCEYNMITWSMSCVTQWLWSIQLKPHLDRTGGHCPSEGGNKDFFAYHVITWSMSQVTYWVRYSHLKSRRLQ